MRGAAQAVRQGRRANRLNDNPAMVTNLDRSWGVRLATFALAALAAASAAYWGLRLSAPVVALPEAAVAVAPPAPDVQAMARLLGAEPVLAVATPAAPAPSASSRFALVGVLAGRDSGGGAGLLGPGGRPPQPHRAGGDGGGGAAVFGLDGHPPKPYRVGAQVDAGLVLQSLGPGQARLGATLHGPAALTLEIPQRR